MLTLNFYLSFSVLLVSFLSGGFFLWRWAHGKRHQTFLLYWGVGFLFLSLFKIPNILAHAGVPIVQTDFYSFFFVTLVAYLLSYCAFNRGLETFIKTPRRTTGIFCFSALLVAAIFYFALTFFKGPITSYPVWLGHIFFYIPAQLFMLHTVWLTSFPLKTTLAIPHEATALAALGILLLLVSSLFYIFLQAWPHPLQPQFWYFSVINSSALSLIQIISQIFLFFGLRGFAHASLKHTR
ncbi:MAG: hypothetical protein A3D67_00485 [Candidatus Lloydbacteria bacterium RIFCSPHIGHO2_02_FULL_51_22]|uniref:Histidine kinase N-terminal 7TM region domain-containing protein n=2 Tax=Candidatus Lloydiibacteriota TaxID=1817910 RepID=A0A1G2DDF0_9BACT|nr:MAG: hypothetical protein A3D67_00485 [Candidatus Lloydbacteria bacterium RIFCSPHIGHO2_02_FULL_51_22]OGZ14160.1 MAG: hypothetical protein A3J08_03775 [Candidatus Lloydbacteria bacterium RIFCSPLOWO2_02_FULL_51_11]